MEILNQARGYSYLLGALKTQQADPYCRSCNAFDKTLLAVKESLEKFETAHHKEIQDLSSEFSSLFVDTKNGLAAMQQPINPISQKKAGNCKLPEGVCFTKSALVLFQKV
jgi:hypothetical protein